MTDDELIRLLAETPLEEWTDEQTELLEARLPTSPQLQAAVTDHLRLEQTLHHALKRVHFSVDEILARDKSNVPLAQGSRRLAIVAVLLAMLLVVGGVVWWVNHDPSGQRDVVTDHEPRPNGTVSANETQSDEKTKSNDVPVTVKVSPPDADSKSNTANIPPVSPATKNAPDDPWTVQLAEPARTFEQAAFDFPLLDKGVIDPTEVARWWETIRGQGRAQPDRRGSIQGYEGVFRLRAPWPAGTALQIAFQSRSVVRFHIYSGKQGATFEYVDRGGGTWTGYQSERVQTNEVLPNRLVFHAYDGDRYQRIGNGIVQFRHQDGQIVLSCGDVLIAAVPLSGVPENVILEAEGRGSAIVIAAMRLIRSATFPLSAVENQADVVETRLRDLPIIRDLPTEAKLDVRDDGTIQLSAGDLKVPATISWPITDPGWHLYDLELDGVTPGAGVFVGDKGGKPNPAVGLYIERRLKQPMMFYANPSEKVWETQHDLGKGPLPGWGDRQWLRLLVRPTKLRVFSSVDGQRWGEMLPLHNNSLKNAGTIGLFVGPSKGPRSITLRRFRTVPLTELPALCPPQWRDQIPDFSAVENVTEWYAKVLQSQPAEVDQQHWRWACAAHALSQGLASTPWSHMIETLLDAARQPDRPWEASVRLLDELSLLVEPNHHNSLMQIAQAYEDVAWKAWRGGELRPFSRIRPVLMSALLGRVPYDPLSSPLAKIEMIDLVNAGQWDGIRQSTRPIRFYSSEFPEPRRTQPREATTRIVTWAEALAQRNRPLADPSALAAIPPAWRHPLVEQLGKEGYNVLAELESALSGGAFKDACQIISSMTSEQAIGLLPNVRDPELLVSLPNAVALAMREQPELARTMQSEFGQLAELRLRQAALEGDAQVMQALTTQFRSTPAAAEAQVWLGDRALSTGDLRRAEAYYRAAQPGVSAATQAYVAARLRLVAAMNGRAEGTPVESDVRLGDVEVSSAVFERLIRDSLKSVHHEAIDQLTEPVAAHPLARVPGPSAYEAVKLAKLEGAAGRDPGSFVRRDLDMLGTQTGITVTPTQFIVNTRFSLTSFDLANGKRLWQQPMDVDQGRTFAWPMVAFRPVVAGQVTLARRLAGWGPELASFDTATGALRWRSPRNEIVASDPIVLAGRVAAVTLAQVQQDVLQLLFTIYDPRTGKVISQQPIVQLRDVWTRELPLVAQAVGDTVVIVGGGCVIGCDLEGNPRWLRRQMWLWGVNDSRTTPVRFDPPLIDGDRAIVAQLGVPTLSCVDIRTGQLHWQKVLPDNSKFGRLLGLGGGRVVVQGPDQLLAYDSQTGDLLWQRVLPGLCEAQAIDSAGNLLLSIGERSSTKSHSIRLLWLDGATGSTVDSAYVRSWAHEQAWFGPLVIHQERMFALAGGDPVGAPVGRDLVELKPVADLPTDGAPTALPSSAWLNARLQGIYPPTFAGWTVLQSTGGDDRPVGWRAESDGRQNVFQTVGTAARPMYLARQLDAVPIGSPKRKLRLNFTMADNSATWQLEVLWKSRVLHQFPAEKQPAKGNYEAEVDVPAEAGWLLVVHRQVGGGSAVALWQHLEVVDYNR